MHDYHIPSRFGDHRASFRSDPHLSPGGVDKGIMHMTTLLVALDDGPNIPLDRSMMVIGRAPTCDARLDSIRVSRHHCCLMHDQGKSLIVVRDLGSTNGIRINGQRVAEGNLRDGDELSIAHIRFKVESNSSEEMTLAEAVPTSDQHTGSLIANHIGVDQPEKSDNPLAAAVREMLPAAMADRCRIQVIVQMPEDEQKAEAASPAEPMADKESYTPESDDPCPPDSSPVDQS